MTRNGKRLITAVSLALSFAVFASEVCCACEAPRAGMVYSSNYESTKKIALTFDDGPDPRHTPEILELLSQYNAHATFFVVGKLAEQYPDLIIRELAGGHEIGNHTYSHNYLSKSTYENLYDEIIDTENTILEIADYRPKLLRPPGGLYNKEVCAAAKRLDYSIILWTIDTRDWAHTSPKRAAGIITDNVKAGDIILMHDFIGKSSPTADILKIVLPELHDMGFEIVCVSELLGSD